MRDFYLTPKFFKTLKGYTKGQFINDIIAGIIVAIIALPLSIALAIASGVEPQMGVYTAVTAGFAVALLGGSRVQIAGPTAAFATIVAGIVAQKGIEGLIVATLMAGIILIVMGVCKLGRFISLVPATITIGFTAGIAVTIFLGQIKDFLGLKYQNGAIPIEALEKMSENIKAISTFSFGALIIGIISLAILIFYPRLEKRIPPSLLAVIVSALLVRFVPFFNENVLTIGDLYKIPSGLPSFQLGNINLDANMLVTLIPDAVTIAVLAAVESLLSCVVADDMIKSKHNPNAELVAQGFGNMFSVMFGGIPATGAIARTAANVKNGGRTPVAGMVHSITLLLVLVFLMPLASMIPMPTIAAILFVVAYNMSEWRKFVGVIKTRKICDIIVLVLTFVLTVIFDLVVAIAVGIALTLIFNLAFKLRNKKI